MKSEKNILFAFVLNLCFSIIEFVGGIITGSVAILSDAIHDIGDATSLGLSFALEVKSKKLADEKYTYGYSRFSVLGGFITTLILIIGSGIVMYNAVHKIIYPTPLDYNGMILIAVIGVIINFIAALLTRKGNSLNQKAVNLHMLEDVLGWIIVLVGATIIKFTNLTIIDPIMSIAVALFILINAIKNVKETLYFFLERTPKEISIAELKHHLLEIDFVLDVHHVHVWKLNEQTICVTMHVVYSSDPIAVKEKVKEELSEHGINHVVLELETEKEKCTEKSCVIKVDTNHHHHHHH